MNRKVVLVIVIVGLMLIMGMLNERNIPSEEEVVALVDSIISWEAVISMVPKLASQPVEESVCVQEKIPSGDPDPWRWQSNRMVWTGNVNIPGEYRCFSIEIFFYERVVNDSNSVTIGNITRIIPLIDGREATQFRISASKGHIWVGCTILTDVEGEPFATRKELEGLMKLVEERLLEINCSVVRQSSSFFIK